MGATILKNPPLGYENLFAGNYDDIPDDRLEVSDENYTPKFIKNFWNGSVWYEGATQEEVDARNLEQTKETVRQFLAKKKQDGRNYFNEIELNITMQLTGMMLVDLVAVSEQIDSILYKPLNLIQKGDYFSAMMLFQNPSKIEPTHPIVLNYWNSMKAYCIAYFNENYPTETID